VIIPAPSFASSQGGEAARGPCGAGRAPDARARGRRGAPVASLPSLRGPLAARPRPTRRARRAAVAAGRVGVRGLDEPGATPAPAPSPPSADRPYRGTAAACSRETVGAGAWHTSGSSARITHRSLSLRTGVVAAWPILRMGRRVCGGIRVLLPGIGRSARFRYPDADGRRSMSATANDKEGQRWTRSTSG
jgi:hypothetical protein